MPTSGKAWFHITLGTYGSWLPGDPRGFRSRHHRVHSSGDHRKPPPTGEHAGLHRHAEAIVGRVVRFSKVQRQQVGERLCEQLRVLGHRVAVMSVSAMHVHLLVELPRSEVKHELGRAKRFASFALRGQIEGRLWGRGCGVKAIVDRSHQERTYRYILRHRGEEAWVWKHGDSGGGEEAHT